MVRIITGKINSGKTSKIKEIFNKTKNGDGFIAKKIMIGTNVYGFNAIRLSNNYEFPFMIHDRYNLETNQDNFVYVIGPYKIYKKSIEYIDKTSKALLDNLVTPLYFDEVGKLELSNQGYSQYIQKAISKNLDIYLTVREDLIIDIITKFKIKKYEIIKG